MNQNDNKEKTEQSDKQTITEPDKIITNKEEIIAYLQETHPDGELKQLEIEAIRSFPGEVILYPNYDDLLN